MSDEKSNNAIASTAESEREQSSLTTPTKNPNSIPPPSEWLSAYNRILDRHPLRTKMITSAIVSAFGSALGSYLSNTSSRKVDKQTGSVFSKINWTDVLSYAIHGGLINAPISHYWFEWLSVNGPSSNTASVLVDQLVVQPPLLVLMFVCLDIFRANIRATINQFREARVISNALENAGPAIVASWRFWPFAVYLTFKYLKKKHYTVALNLCSVAWTVYLSRRSPAVSK
ncbi:hypothetical protein HJC23_011304 [Cyclotella cryptica]|uniref:Uncharacterized protein n=1 Tax=Cyclotella cryptica TaxID=29204 RepID=A0ABD3QX28_9STRA